MRAPVEVAYNWTGFYAGAHVGYGWGRTEFRDPLDYCIGTGSCPFPRFDYDLGGVIGGAQAGYNWQTGNLVFGLEFDFSFSGIDKTAVVRTTGNLSTDLDWLGTGRLRLGYAVNQALLYATGGFAYAKVSNAYRDGSTFLGASEVNWGWTVGGGVEFAFAANWTLRGEYLFVDIAENSATFAPPTIGHFEWDNRLHILRAALNYRFGAPVVARY